ncbi:nucleotidyltransferase domain-containing protein [Candidatus Pyrohabitans sp.]
MKSLLEIGKEFCRKAVEAGALDAVIFGSVARGGVSEESDVDVMVVVDEKEVTERIYRIAGEYLRGGVVIGLILVNPEEFCSMVELQTPLIENIAREGICHGEFIKKTIGVALA